MAVVESGPLPSQPPVPFSPTPMIAAPPQKVVISLGLGGSPSDVVSGKAKKKLKKAKKGTGGPPEEFEKIVPPAPTEKK